MELKNGVTKSTIGMESSTSPSTIDSAASDGSESAISPPPASGGNAAAVVARKCFLIDSLLEERQRQLAEEAAEVSFVIHSDSTPEFGRVDSASINSMNTPVERKRKSAEPEECMEEEYTNSMARKRPRVLKKLRDVVDGESAEDDDDSAFPPTDPSPPTFANGEDGGGGGMATELGRSPMALFSLLSRFVSSGGEMAADAKMPPLNGLLFDATTLPNNNKREVENRNNNNNNNNNNESAVLSEEKRLAANRHTYASESNASAIINDYLTRLRPLQQSASSLDSVGVPRFHNANVSAALFQMAAAAAAAAVASSQQQRHMTLPFAATPNVFGAAVLFQQQAAAALEFRQRIAASTAVSHCSGSASTPSVCSLNSANRMEINSLQRNQTNHNNQPPPSHSPLLSAAGLQALRIAVANAVGAPKSSVGAAAFTTATASTHGTTPSGSSSVCSTATATTIAVAPSRRCGGRHRGIGNGGYPHRSSNAKKYRCDICDKTFSRSNTLITHKRIHTGEKPFSCEHCGRAFRQPGNLTRHAYTHTTVKPFVCAECGKAFNRASNLQTHMRVHGVAENGGALISLATTSNASPNHHRSHRSAPSLSNAAAAAAAAALLFNSSNGATCMDADGRQVFRSITTCLKLTMTDEILHQPNMAESYCNDSYQVKSRNADYLGKLFDFFNSYRSNHSTKRL